MSSGRAVHAMIRPSMGGTERRRHVRLKPIADLPVRVALAGDGLLREALDVADISVGGLSLTSPALRGVAPGQRLKLHLTFGELGAHEEHAIEAIARWVKGDAAGLEVVTPEAGTAKAIERYVAELLERGGSP
jgi:hypothetical protein